ncbi:VPLPA-CTERM sorting domain-containing protein [Celeribacter neptunius]|uniref:VPLPA-CTERM protein sorting domain-containing protein n=1 Tax=Celeribacter neptunius TaxID=588602 RepID=A0A1I3RVQ4_9RHOB|nr:VPLPA-CTERM sorting domain-containing protein [Celeribacter neptunius]SFJ50428.1 VPLPA-CTERM protein sorting domain-containing protein [Celeribacter neptunius]
MKHIVLSAALLSFAAGAQAATIDFSDSAFASTFDGIGATTYSTDGVLFSFSATARGVDGYRQAFGGGLGFGVPGNGMYSVAFTADQDITVESLSGHGHSLTGYAGQLPFDIARDGVSLIDDFMFASASDETYDFGGTPIALEAGSTLSFVVDFGALSGSSIYASAVFEALDFTATSLPAVPLPAGAPLLLGGVAALGLLRRRKSCAL